MEQKKREHREWRQKVTKLDQCFEGGKAIKKDLEEAFNLNDKAIEEVESF